MSLVPGARFGAYVIGPAIGAGGMGQVYRATDTHLKRDVALKVLPDALAGDPERLARFQREAEVLARLNHPHIATIYGLERRDGTTALAMELVEGPTLADRIAQGPLPVDEALPIAHQLADALGAAHDQGIIHRDLKPANIKVRPDGTVKVLDFGLAKALDPPSALSPDLSQSPTITSPAQTLRGVILGTAAYMSPEQARGKAVDRRADIWAFGAVLFEMLTGTRAFPGEDITDTLALVVRGEPAWASLPPGVPARVRQVLQACLQKDPKQRLGDMQSVRLVLEGALETAATGDAAQPVGAAPRSVLARALPWAVAAAFGIALGVAVWALWRSDRPADRPLVRANLTVPGFDSSSAVGINLALSPDGTRLVYVEHGKDGQDRLATRLLAERTATVLAGTEGARLPFFSPDGRWIGFGADGQLKKVSVLGGAPVTLTAAPVFEGGSWAKDGSIVATVNIGGPMLRIPAAGGAGAVLLPRPTFTPILPQVLPGGQTVIFGGQDAQGPVVQLLSLETKHLSTLIRGAPWARYLPTHGTTTGATGHLIYPSGDTLLAAPFDPAAGAVRGAAIPVLDEVAGPVAFSSTGDAAYVIGTAASGAGGWPLRWLRPDGKIEPLLDAKARYLFPRVSPDGNLLAVTVDNGRPGKGQLLVYDWRHDRMLALTEKGQAWGPAVWTPDSRSVIWATPRTHGKTRFMWKRADGSGEAHTLVESSTYYEPSAISPDGRYLALVGGEGATQLDLWVAPLDLSQPGTMKLGEAKPLVRLPRTQAGPVFSPDGRWIAYSSDESGTYQVYVQRFPGGGGLRQVSEDEGIYPRWSPNGRQLLYVNPTEGNRIMAVDYQGHGEAFVASKPRVWSPTPIQRFSAANYWDLDPQGERAVVVAPEQAGPPKVAYLLHFFDYLRRKAPVGK